MYKVIGADQNTYGPIAADQVCQWIQQHRLNGQSLAQAEGADQWIPLSQFPEFRAALEAVTPPHPLSAPYDYPGFRSPPRTNSLAITGFVMGLLAICFCCCCYGFPFNVMGIVFSALGLSQINQNPDRESGKALAVAGLVLSLLSVALGILLLSLNFAFKNERILMHFQP